MVGEDYPVGMSGGFLMTVTELVRDGFGALLVRAIACVAGAPDRHGGFSSPCQLFHDDVGDQIQSGIENIAGFYADRLRSGKRRPSTMSRTLRRPRSTSTDVGHGEYSP